MAMKPEEFAYSHMLRPGRAGLVRHSGAADPYFHAMQAAGSGKGGATSSGGSGGASSGPCPAGCKLVQSARKDKTRCMCPPLPCGEICKDKCGGSVGNCVCPACPQCAVGLPSDTSDDPDYHEPESPACGCYGPSKCPPGKQSGGRCFVRSGPGMPCVPMGGGPCNKSQIKVYGNNFCYNDCSCY